MPPEERSEESKRNIREPLTAAKQKRLDALLDHARIKMSGDKPDFDYATDLLSQCVMGNPSNIFYVKEYVENLQKKYNNNKTGKSLAKFSELGSRMAQKKAVEQENWDDVIKHGLKVLTVNPWDKTALINLAKAVSKFPNGFEAELYFLKTALLPNSKDADVNKLCAIALTAIGDTDQAITCWHRVEQAERSSDEVEEAKRHIAYINAQKMGARHGSPGGDSDGWQGSGPSAVVEEVLTPEKKLLRKIAQQPGDMAAYLELSQMYIHAEKYGEAEKILAKAFENSGGDVEIREKWEDAELRHLRQQLSKIQDPVEKKKQEKKIFAKELEVCKNRCERFPNDGLFRFDLGYHYMLLKQYNEAIRELQKARNDPRKKGPCLLALGQCFQQIQQYSLAMDHYEMAIEDIPDRDAQNKKKALHLAGKLALGLKNVEKAEKHLLVLAGLDFTYKDVPALLDKLAKLRKNVASASDSSPQESKPEA